jgi:hypothetical protein
LIEGLRSASAANFSYSAYQEFLNRYLVPGKYIGDIKLNVADYDAIHKDLERPDSLYEKILRQLADSDPNVFQKREDEIAFWINAYNIGAIKMIIDHLNSFEALRLHKNLYERYLRKALEGKESKVVTCGGQ